MTEQLEMFETPKQKSAREYNEALAAYMEARRVESGYQCQDCGGIAPTEGALWINHGHALWINHGHMGSRCLRVYLRRNHARYALRTGDLERWVTATADLRRVAAWWAGMADSS